MKILRLGQSLCSNNPSIGFTNIYSLDFDGVDDYVTMGNVTLLEITGDVTVSAWLYLRSFQNNDVVVRMGGDTELEADNFLYTIAVTGSGATGSNYNVFGGHEYSTGSNQFSVFTTNLSLSTWYHIAMVRDTTAKTWTLYVNGSDYTPYTYTHQATGGTTSPFQFAKNSTQYLDGIVDEVSVFNTDLSDAQILNIYNSGTPTDLSGESNLVGYWRNGDPTGTGAYPTIVDVSKGNDGTMTNMASGDIITTVP